MANDQLRRLRPHVIENAVDFEWETFKSQLKEGSTSIHATIKWLKPYAIDPHQPAPSTDPLTIPTIQAGNGTVDMPSSAPTVRDRLMEAYIKLIQKFSRMERHPKHIPETFKLDTSRLSTYCTEWQDITIMAVLLMMFRQMAGPKCHGLHCTEMKKQLWLLLNDNDTSMDHLAVHIGEGCGKIRGRPLAATEQDALKNMIEKSLTHESKVYELLNKRVGDELLEYLKTGHLHEMESLVKSALGELKTELAELADKIRALFEHNSAVYHKIYDQILRRNI